MSARLAWHKPPVPDTSAAQVQTLEPEISATPVQTMVPKMSAIQVQTPLVSRMFVPTNRNQETQAVTIPVSPVPYDYINTPT